MNHGMAPGLFGMLWSSGHVRAGVCSCYRLDGSQTYKRLEQDYIQFRGSVLNPAVGPQRKGETRRFSTGNDVLVG